MLCFLGKQNLNPSFFCLIHLDHLNHKKNPVSVGQTLAISWWAVPLCPGLRLCQAVRTVGDCLSNMGVWSRRMWIMFLSIFIIISIVTTIVIGIYFSYDYYDWYYWWWYCYYVFFYYYDRYYSFFCCYNMLQLLFSMIIIMMMTMDHDIKATPTKLSAGVEGKAFWCHRQRWRWPSKQGSDASVKRRTKGWMSRNMKTIADSKQIWKLDTYVYIYTICIYVYIIGIYVYNIV